MDGEGQRRAVSALNGTGRAEPPVPLVPASARRSRDASKSPENRVLVRPQGGTQ